jgi:protein-L-isoaspartate(D-aspartate) O-methyltransferase
MQDTYRHLGMRRRLVEQIAAEYPFSSQVLEAMLKVPRHFFFEKAFVEKAYENNAFPIGEEQTISQPFTVAFQTELLQVDSGMQVLEIGTGSGYQACILAAMGAKVYTIERNKKLYEKALYLLNRINYKHPITALLGDGYEGAIKYAPFDRILATAAAPEIPQNLLAQLKIGGRLVAPIGSEVQEMTLLIKHSDTEIEEIKYGRFRFVPMLKGVVL